jgi:hypothetical protein
MSKERGFVTFQLGGVQQRLAVPIWLAVQIEAETGKGVIAHAISFARGEGQFRHAVEIVRCALAENGKEYSSKEVAELAAHEGIPALMTAAARILNALFPERADGRAGKKSQGVPGQTGTP